VNSVSPVWIRSTFSSANGIGGSVVSQEPGPGQGENHSTDRPGLDW
jgi:hypothetical protein